MSKGIRKKTFVSTFHSPIAAWVILCIGLVLTFSAWYTSNSLVHKNGRQRFENRVEEIRNAIHSQMLYYEQLLWSGTGLFNASDQVTREEFRRYVKTLALNEQWPGIQGIGYSIPVRPEDKDAHIQTIRSEGYAEYTIRPEGQREQYSAIVYLEPFDWRNQRAFGFDMWSNEVRRTAMTRARDTGTASTSGMITLVQETEEDVQRGFLTYVPLYRRGMPTDTQEERRAAFVGWVYAPFRMGDFMKSILGSGKTDVEYEIYGSQKYDDTTMLYDSNADIQGSEGDDDTWRVKETLELQGQTWTLFFHAGEDAIFVSEAKQPLVVAMAGLIVDLLLFYVISSIAYLQKKAEGMASEMTLEIREAHEQLEQKILESEHLVHALRNTNDELSQFAFVASHDLREPLRKVKTFGGMLRAEVKDGLSERGDHFLNFMESAVIRMESLLSSLLAYSRVYSKEKTVEEVDLNALFKDVCADLELQIKDVDGKVEVDSLPTLEGDPAQLRQLFQNLISNSLNYHRHDVPPLIRIVNCSTPKERSIAVKDNGIGFEKVYAEKIFEVFQRLHGRDEYPGTGIGLAICRKIAERHSGRIFAESVLGQGSVFTVVFPLGLNQSETQS